MLSEVVYLVLLIGVLIFSLVAIFSREIFKAAVSLVFAFIFLSGMYLLLGAEFLAVIQLIIYAGAIAILILFAIMHTPAKIENLGDAKIFDYKPHYINAFIIGIIIFSILIFIGMVILNELNVNVNNYKVTLVDFANALFNIKDFDNYGGRFVLVFELAGILILASIIAAITVAKKE
ncbi:MAG: NADH-quinone oxidoreductase subunit J [bacterium]|nr:NADH-quinone oxidoreductase subunit J [bacterium]